MRETENLARHFPADFISQPDAGSASGTFPRRAYPISEIEKHFDSICERVAGGDSLAATLRDLGIAKHTFDNVLRQRRDLKDRYTAARPVDGLALIAVKFDDILATIVSGVPVRKAILGSGCSDSAFYKYVKRTPGTRERLVAAAEPHQRNGRRVSLTPQRRYTEAEIDAALDRFAKARSGRTTDLTGVASAHAIFGRAYRNPEFKARLRAVMGERAKRREAARPPVSPKGSSHHLADELLRDELYLAARSVVRGFDPNDIDDAISELYLAVLEGEIELADRKQARKLALRRAVGERQNFRSLDAPISGSANSDTLGDEVASPCIIHTF